MIRILFLLVTFISFSIMAKPEKDFQLYCVWEVWDTHAVYKYRDEGTPRIIEHRLYIPGHEITDSEHYLNDWYRKYPENYLVDHDSFKLSYRSHLLKDEDEDKYYFGDARKQRDPSGLKYEIELNRKTLGINWYECNFITNERADRTVKLWEEWRKAWRIKYPKPKPPKNQI